MKALFHVSDQHDIERFIPRLPLVPNASIDLPVVWAVDQKHLANYLLPRECLRVCFHETEHSSNRDRERFLGPGGTHHVIAIEAQWLERAVEATLWVYEFAPELFACADPTAGYFVSTAPVSPVSRRRVENPLSELAALGVGLRVMASVVDLASAVASSSRAFSCIRMRNAVG